MNIQRVWRGRSSLSQDLPEGSVLRFISRRHDRIDAHFKWGAKIVIFFVFMRFTLNEFMAFVDFLDFHNNWPECSWDINIQTVWGFEEIRNISLVTSRSVTTTEIFPIWVNNGNNNCLIIVEVQNRFSQEQIGLSKNCNLAFLTESGAHYIV